MDEERSLSKARQSLLRWLGYRSRSCREAAAYLEKKGYAGPQVETVLAEMLEQGYLDDDRFADELLRYCRRKGLGPVRALLELKRRGVDRTLAEDKVKQFFHEGDDLARACALLEKRAALEEGNRDQRWFRRQAAFLKRRGFHDRVIIEALRAFGSAETADPFS